MDLSLAPYSSLELFRALFSKPEVEHPTPSWELIPIVEYSKGDYDDGMRLVQVQAPPSGVEPWTMNSGRTFQVRVKRKHNNWFWTGTGTSKRQIVDAAEALRERWVRREAAASRRRSIAKHACRGVGKGLTDYLSKRHPSRL